MTTIPITDEMVEAGARARLLKARNQGQDVLLFEEMDSFDQWNVLGQERACLTAALAGGSGDETPAVHDVLAERRRQIEVEDWTPAHDDKHKSGELARAGACYALFGSNNDNWRYGWHGQPPVSWPWEVRWWKPKDRRRDLVRAGALILAEIERLDRIGLAPPVAAPDAEVGK